MVYVPAFSRYSPAVTRAIARIEKARAEIEAARILPPQEDILRRSAHAESVHYSNLIEGNELPLIEAQRAVRGDLEATTRARIELVNYVKALEYLEAHRAEIAYTPAFLKDVHRVLMAGLGRPGNRFSPDNEGEWRDGDVVVADAIAVFHTSPAAAELDHLMGERLAWLEEKRTSADYFAPVLAAIAHFEITEVHPFADGNGRVARLFAVAVLMREGYAARLLFSPERYYAEDTDAYYAALRASKRQGGNLNTWLEYFARGLAEEFERVATEASRLSALTTHFESSLQLSRHQEVALSALTTSGRHSLTRAEFAELAGIGRSQATAELTKLIDAGILRREHRGATTSYALRRPGTRAGKRGPTRRWTDESIREALETLVNELGRFPGHQDFVDRELKPLYVAASRSGGIRRWREELSENIG